MSERWQPVPVPSGPDPLGDDGRVAVYRRLVEDFAHCHQDVPEEVRRQMAMLAAASVRALMGELAALKDISGLPSAGESPQPTAGDAPRAETKTERDRIAANILGAKYLNPECAESGCQWLRASTPQADGAPLGVREWYPIETAPRSTTAPPLLLLFYPGGLVKSGYRSSMSEGKHPTHWMPLPAPPDRSPGTSRQTEE